jgi:uncharacterized delta-60 repeat protein
VELRRGGNRWVLTLLLASCALVASATGFASEATAAKGTSGPGGLDRSFSGNGKLVIDFPRDEAPRTAPHYALPYEFAPGRIAMASAGGGRLVVASSKAILSYLRNGRPDPRFGGNGAVAVGPVAGSRFQLADIAVDSQGRVLVAGTTKPTSGQGMTGLSLAGPIPSVATIRRYLPDGRLDPGFGNEGVLNTTLGAQPPTFEGQQFKEPAVAVVGLAVDGLDRPVLTGSAVFEVGLCAPSQNRFERSQAIVARLSTNGAADPTFAATGLRSIGGLSWLGWAVPTATGHLSFGASVDPCPQGGPDDPSVIASIGADGNSNPGFSGTGFWSRPFVRIADLAVAPSGKIVLLARTIELVRGQWVESKGRAMRLRPNGSVDTGFGRGGSTDLPLKRGSVSAIAVDAKGRVLLVGQVAAKPQRKKGPRSLLLLMRTTAAGKADLGFGRKGRVTIGFGPRTMVLATEVLAEAKGRIVAGAKISGPRTSTDNAFAIARYVGGNVLPRPVSDRG